MVIVAVKETLDRARAARFVSPIDLLNAPTSDAVQRLQLLDVPADGPIRVC